MSHAVHLASPWVSTVLHIHPDCDLNIARIGVRAVMTVVSEVSQAHRPRVMPGVHDAVLTVGRSLLELG